LQSFSAWADVVRQALPIYNQSLQMKETHDAFRKFYAHLINLQRVRTSFPLFSFSSFAFICACHGSTQHRLASLQEAAKDRSLLSVHSELVAASWQEILANHDRLNVGESFYLLLLSRYPQLLSVFGSTDMERQVRTSLAPRSPALGERSANPPVRVRVRARAGFSFCRHGRTHRRSVWRHVCAGEAALANQGPNKGTARALMLRLYRE
jgi:hypothetical protein